MMETTKKQPSVYNLFIKHVTSTRSIPLVEAVNIWKSLPDSYKSNLKSSYMSNKYISPHALFENLQGQPPPALEYLRPDPPLIPSRDYYPKQVIKRGRKINI